MIILFFRDKKANNFWSHENVFRWYKSRGCLVALNL